MTSGATQLAELKGAGYKVTVTHQRKYESVANGTNPAGFLEWVSQIMPTGGTTLVEISWPDKPEEILARGGAYCCDRDNYNRKLGLTIAIGRARKALEGSGK